MDHKDTIIAGLASVCIAALIFAGFILYINKPAEPELTKAVGSVFEVKKQEIATSTENALSKEVAAVPKKLSPSVEKSKESIPDSPREETVPLVKPELSKFVEAVVKIECAGANDAEMTAGGSGVSFYDENGMHRIATNAHVVRSYDGSFGGCWVYFPETDGTFYKSAYWAGEGYLYDDKVVMLDGVEYGGKTSLDGGLDYALLTLTEPGTDVDGSSYPGVDSVRFPDIIEISETTCGASELKIGEEILVLGYPGIGGSSLTVTDGIVSGFNGYFKEFIKTSAKVEHGNSGGLAMRADDGCLIGIPSGGYTGSMETMSDIIDYRFASYFINAIESSTARDYRDMESLDPFTIEHYPALSWRDEKNAHQTLLNKHANALTFSACTEYALNECLFSRTMSVPSRDKEKLWKASVETESVPFEEWASHALPIVNFYDIALAEYGFVRDNVVFVPEEKFAIVPDMLPASLDAIDGAVFRYARPVGNAVQFAILDIEVFAEALEDCSINANCKVKGIEEYLLYISEPVPLKVMLTSAHRTEWQGMAALSVEALLAAQDRIWEVFR